MLTSFEIDKILDIAQAASGMALKFFDDSKYRKATAKEDGSPVTRADKDLSDFLMKELSIFGYPVVSEESSDSHMSAESYFIIDPIDGTKYFARHEPEFAVLIGFIHGGRPQFGCVADPVGKKIYHGIKGSGAFLDGRKIFHSGVPQNIRAYSSGFHKKPASRGIIERFDIGEVLTKGSALKFCDMAEGKVDLFPRFGNTGEWDTAAAQVILEESNCALIDIQSVQPMVYGKARRLNRGFIACENGLVAKVQKFIELELLKKVKGPS